jgi:hypothetical protein
VSPDSILHIVLRVSPMEGASAERMQGAQTATLRPPKVASA